MGGQQRLVTQWGYVLVRHLSMCAIQGFMKDPVVAADGQTYERAAIQEWLDRGNRASPKSGAQLEHTSLTPNYNLRSQTQAWQQQLQLP